MSPAPRHLKNTRKFDSVAAAQRRSASHVIAVRRNTPRRSWSTPSMTWASPTSGLAPLAVPRGASGPCVTLPCLALPSAVGTRGHVRSIDAQHHPRPTQAARRHRRNAVRDGLTGRRHRQDGAPLGGLMHKRMETLTAQRHPGEVAKQRLRLLLGHRDRHLGRRLLHSEWCAPWRSSECRITWIHPSAP